MKLGFGLSLVTQGGGTPAPFAVALTGLTNGEAIIGDHATISYTTDPVSATETVKWSNSSNPADAATYGTGANPTDFTAGDEGRLYLHVTDTVDGETATVTRSALIRYARGTAPAVADGQAWTVDDTSVNIDGSASGANLTFTYAITGLPAGVTINASSGAITGTPTAVDSGTATITATDQYGLNYIDTFTWANALRTQATAAGGLGPFSFTQDVAISNQDLSADFTANGNTLTYTISPALPAGLSLASNGILSGTPTATAASATYTVTGQDEYGRDTDSSFTLEVVEASGFTPADLFASGEEGAWYDIHPDYLFQNSDGTGAITVGDPVGYVTDRSGNGKHLVQATTSYKPTLRQTAGGLYYLEPDKTDDLMSAGVAGDFNFLHDGTGCEWFFAAQPDDVVNPADASIFWITGTLSTSDIGSHARYDDRTATSSNNSFQYAARKGSTGNPVFEETDNNTIPTMTDAYVFNGGHATSRSPNYFANRDATAVYSGNYTNTPVTSNSTNALTLFARASNDLHMGGKFFGGLFIDRVLTTQERSDTRAYFADKAGVTL